MAKPDPLAAASARMRPLPHLIFMSRWLQLPLYLGLIVAQCVYVVQFWIELIHLVEVRVGDLPAFVAIERRGGRIGRVGRRPEKAGAGGYVASDLYGLALYSNAS